MPEILTQNRTQILVTLKQNESETQCNSLRGFTCSKYILSIKGSPVPHIEVLLFG